MTGKGETHQEMWKRYIRGELDPKQMDLLDGLLREDDAAFQSYMQALMTVESELPSLSTNTEEFADYVISALPNTSPARTHNFHRSRKRWHQPMVHYTLAAAMTILLLAGGVFDMLSAGAEEMSERNNVTQPLSDRLMERAAGWIDRMNANEPISETGKDEAK